MRSCIPHAPQSHISFRIGTPFFATERAASRIFLKQGGREGLAVRRQKWDWIQQGIAAPGAPEKIRLYDAYLHKMEKVLATHTWLAGDTFSMADIAMTPYVNRLAALSMEGLWRNGRLPCVEQWFERIRARPAFEPAFVKWMPVELAAEMQANGRTSWPQVKALLEIP